MSPFALGQYHLRNLLESEVVCGNSNRAVQLPFNLMYVALKNAQAWNLSYCRYCQQSLTDNVPSEINFKHMSATDADMLTNGRALLSALYYGYYHSTLNENKSSLNALKVKRGRGMSLADVLGLTVRTMSIQDTHDLATDSGRPFVPTF